MYGFYLKAIVNLFKMNTYTFFFYTNDELSRIKTYKANTLDETEEKADKFLELNNYSYYTSKANITNTDLN